MDLYIVTYHVEGRVTILQDTINLLSCTPSEFFTELKQHDTIRQKEIILSLVPTNTQMKWP
ncbi:MAG: hypothetical protein IJ163_06955 [Bacteroidaceae bacterium]|nr:hypothetical protein [Bacteroidaceae bacterium]